MALLKKGVTFFDCFGTIKGGVSLVGQSMVRGGATRTAAAVFRMLDYVSFWPAASPSFRAPRYAFVLMKNSVHVLLLTVILFFAGRMAKAKVYYPLFDESKLPKETVISLHL